MNDSEMAALLSNIADRWPHSPFETGTVVAYREELQPLDFEIATFAVRRLYNDPKQFFMPLPARIIEQARIVERDRAEADRAERLTRALPEPEGVPMTDEAKAMLAEARKRWSREEAHTQPRSS